MHFILTKESYWSLTHQKFSLKSSEKIQGNSKSDFFSWVTEYSKTYYIFFVSTEKSLLRVIDVFLHYNFKTLSVIDCCW